MKPQPPETFSVHDLGLNGKMREIKCPWGEPGHTLLGKETFLKRNSGKSIVFKADMDEVEAAGVGAMYGGWKPSIFMPLVLSRIRPKIEAIRIERVNEISADDARAEGVCDRTECLTGKFPTSNYLNLAPDIFPTRDQLAVANYGRLFESINGLGSFDGRWVWVITFERFKG